MYVSYKQSVVREAIMANNAKMETDEFEDAKDKMTVGVYEFKWESLLGRGVFGSAYLGHHVNDKEEAVVRVVHMNELEIANDDIKALFQRDREIVMKLQRHKNIIKYMLDMQIENSLYFVMEYCQHKSLEYYMKAHSPDRKTKLKIMQQCADIVSCIHAQDPPIIHRCIQPAVILIKGDPAEPEIKLVNFQYAVYYDSDNAPTDAVGGRSQLYMAPEMFQAVKYDAKVDVFSLGCVFLAMINFSGEDSCDMKPFPESELEKETEKDVIALGARMVQQQKVGITMETILKPDDINESWNDVIKTTLQMIQFKPDVRSSAEEVKENLDKIPLSL